jgi:hypothetical protein
LTTNSEEAPGYFYPGAKASVEINSVKIGDSEIPDYITVCFTKDLEIDALEYLERINEGYADYLYDASRRKTLRIVFHT